MIDRIDIRKPPFSKEEMLEELKEILFCQASQIAVSLSSEAADAFIGFEVDSWHSASFSRIDDEIDLKRFNITPALETAYDYAFQVGAYWRYGSSTGYDIEALGHGVSGATYEGSPNPYLGENSRVRHAVELAVAREYLDGENSLTIQQLCLLSDMSEASVRNSLSKEGVPTSGKPVSIENEDARNWLLGRRGFIPTRTREIVEQSKSEYFQFLLSTYPAYECVRRVLIESGQKPEEIAQAANVSLAHFTSLLEGDFTGIDIDFLKAVGNSMEFDVPFFVGRAIEEVLRKEQYDVSPRIRDT